MKVGHWLSISYRLPLLRLILQIYLQETTKTVLTNRKDIPMNSLIAFPRSYLIHNMYIVLMHGINYNCNIFSTFNGKLTYVPVNLMVFMVGWTVSVICP